MTSFTFHLEVRKSQIRCFNFPKSYAYALTNGFRLFVVNLHTKPCNMLSRTICLFINLFVCVLAYSQDTTAVVKPRSMVALTQTNKHPAALPSLLLSPNLIAIYPPKVINTLPAGYYYNSVGFFCQKELQVEKALKVPLKIRLGSVNYTDRLEGKSPHNVSFP